MAKKKKSRLKNVRTTTGLVKQTVQPPKPRTTAQKRAMRLDEGFPLSTGETTKKSPKTSGDQSMRIATGMIDRMHQRDVNQAKQRAPVNVPKKRKK